MLLPHVILTQQDVAYIQGNEITHFPIFSRINNALKSALALNMTLLPRPEPYDVVMLWVGLGCWLESLSSGHGDQTLLIVVLKKKMEKLLMYSCLYLKHALSFFLQLSYA
jgi:hypothetical protein